jgi:hypothetical protein
MSSVPRIAPPSLAATPVAPPACQDLARISHGGYRRNLESFPTGVSDHRLQAVVTVSGWKPVPGAKSSQLARRGEIHALICR